MRRILLPFFLLVCGLYSYGQTVYVCSASSTSKYHINKDCRGLKSCGSPVKSTTIAAMRKQGRGACKICSDGVVSSTPAKTNNVTATSNNTSKQTTVTTTKPFNTTGLEIPVTAQGRVAQVIKHIGYTTCYNSNWLIPNWVAYDITKQKVHGTFPRPKRPFEPDPLVKGKTAEHDDYTNSGYSRGHMAPAADMKWSEQAMNESFYLSNICPQLAELNGGVWERLEERCRALADDGTVYICCGPIMSSTPKRIGANGVAVPAKFFKVLCMQRKGHWQAIGFIMHNSAIKGSMFDYAMSVDDVEKATGHNFFPSLPDDIEKIIESAWKMKDWQ